MQIPKNYQTSREIGVDGILYMLDDERDIPRYRTLCDEEIKQETRRVIEISSTIKMLNGTAFQKSRSGTPRSASFVPPHFGTSTKRNKIEKKNYDKIILADQNMQLDTSINNQQIHEKISLEHSLKNMEKKYELNLAVMDKLLKDKATVERELNHMQKKEAMKEYSSLKKRLRKRVTDSHIVDSLIFDEIPINNQDTSDALSKSNFLSKTNLVARPIVPSPPPPPLFRSRSAHARLRSSSSRLVIPDMHVTNMAVDGVVDSPLSHRSNTERRKEPEIELSKLESFSLKQSYSKSSSHQKTARDTVETQPNVVHDKRDEKDTKDTPPLKYVS